VTYSDVIKHGGVGLIGKVYNGSLVNALKSVYPEFQWEEWNFSRVTAGFWKEKSNQKAFLDYVAKKLGIINTEDWYRVKQSDIHRMGGDRLLRYYGDSLTKALQTIYPDSNWEMWRFGRSPRGFWDDQNNASKFLQSVSNQLGLNTVAELYTITRKHFDLMKGKMSPGVELSIHRSNTCP
jgi:hypothetical protein